MAQTVADKERMCLNPLFPIYSGMVVFEEESFVGNLQRVEVMGRNGCMCCVREVMAVPGD